MIFKIHRAAAAAAVESEVRSKSFSKSKLVSSNEHEAIGSALSRAIISAKMVLFNA